MSRNKARGTLLGLACGDALGRPVEFKSRGEIQTEYGTVDEMIGYGTWGKPAGTITDDTEQALCIARSLTEQGAFDPTDVADRFVAWFNSGPFDVGRMTAKALRRLDRGESWEEAGQSVWEESAEGANAGNGSVMRCPPLAIAFADDFGTLQQVSRQSSQITHADPRCTYGCAILNHTIAGHLPEQPDPLTDALDDLENDAPAELLDALRPILRSDELDKLETSGYVVHSLQTALQDALTSDTAEEAIVTAVNRGGDTDTIGAIAGAVAGARFGAESLPERWLDALEHHQELNDLAKQLKECKQ